MSRPQLALAVDGRGAVPLSVFSPGERYRYTLHRRWSEGPVVLFVMLNPSTATDTQDDPTIRRCIGFAKAWGYSGLDVGNLCALRSTDPAALYPDTAAAVGVDNDKYLLRMAGFADRIVCAWGSVRAPLRFRVGALISLLRQRHNLHSLTHNKDGSPGHPLYLRSGLTPKLWHWRLEPTDRGAGGFGSTGS